MLAAILFAVPANFYATPPRPVQVDLKLNGFFAADKAQKGRTIQAAIVLEVPQGYHINANRPLSKLAIPTTLKIEAPGGIKVGPIIFPRAIVRRLQASNNEQLAVYEGRAVVRFNVTIPANFQSGVTELRARLRFQGCNDEVCFPPATREVNMPIGIVGATDSVKRINGNLFGGGKGRRG
jgi:DsbC/DsbD-like thiol-disulfide interchange protein